jgi:hypothetical protein
MKIGKKCGGLGLRIDRRGRQGRSHRQQNPGLHDFAPRDAFGLVHRAPLEVRQARAVIVVDR